MRKNTIEKYLELIHNLQKENERVQTNDMAYFLGIAPASVTEIFQKLSEGGYIDYEKYSGAILTDKGKKLAKQIKKKHDALKEFLLLLGVDKRIADKDACEMEHILHPKTLDAIAKFAEVINRCKVTPFWLQRLKKYNETGKLSKCPSELINICIKYSKKFNAK